MVIYQISCNRLEIPSILPASYNSRSTFNNPASKARNPIPILDQIDTTIIMFKSHAWSCKKIIGSVINPYFNRKLLIYPVRSPENITCQTTAIATPAASDGAYMAKAKIIRIVFGNCEINHARKNPSENPTGPTNKANLKVFGKTFCRNTTS